MKNIICFLISLFSLSVPLLAQNFNVYYPFIQKVYESEDVNGESGPSVEADFDGDGMNDLAVILFDKQESLPVFCIFLSSLFKKERSYKYCDWTFMMHDLQYQNSVLTLSSDDGSMGNFGSMKLKYDKVKQQLKIIKYEDSSGNKMIQFKTGKI